MIVKARDSNAMRAERAPQSEHPAPSTLQIWRPRVLICLIVSTFVGVNMLINWLIAHVIGGLLAKALILYAYYALIRKVIQWFAFPGSLYWSQRTVEYQ